MTTISDVMENFTPITRWNPIFHLRGIWSLVVGSKACFQTEYGATWDGLLVGDIILLWRIHLEPLRQRLGFLSTSNILMGFMRRNTEGFSGEGLYFYWIRFWFTGPYQCDHEKAILKKRRELRVCPRWKQLIWIKLCLNIYGGRTDGAVPIRGYQLTDKGKQALKDYQAIIDRHPKKKHLKQCLLGAVFLLSATNLWKRFY